MTFDTEKILTPRIPAVSLLTAQRQYNCCSSFSFVRPVFVILLTSLLSSPAGCGIPIISAFLELEPIHASNMCESVT